MFVVVGHLSAIQDNPFTISPICSLELAHKKHWKRGGVFVKIKALLDLPWLAIGWTCSAQSTISGDSVQLSCTLITYFHDAVT